MLQLNFLIKAVCFYVKLQMPQDLSGLQVYMLSKLALFYL